MHASRFRKEVLSTLEPARGTYIYEASVRDLNEKTSPEDPCGYGSWLRGLIEYARRILELTEMRILDLGCGHGEFTVMMNLMGYDAMGLDVSDESLRLARILADENGIAPGRFVKGENGKLPFDDKSFDLVVMISSLEHISDATLSWLVPELDRVCRGIVFVQVPSAMKISDDHTGLKFVPWLPPRVASAYIALRGRRYRYWISESHEWDVTYRDLRTIENRFAKHFSMSIVPPEHSYPPIGQRDAVLDVKKRIDLGAFSFSVRIPLVTRYLQKAMGARIEHFYPYYNVAFRNR